MDNNGQNTVIELIRKNNAFRYVLLTKVFNELRTGKKRQGKKMLLDWFEMFVSEK